MPFMLFSYIKILMMDGYMDLAKGSIKASIMSHDELIQGSIREFNEFLIL